MSPFKKLPGGTLISDGLTDGEQVSPMDGACVPLPARAIAAGAKSYTAVSARTAPKKTAAEQAAQDELRKEREARTTTAAARRPKADRA